MWLKDGGEAASSGLSGWRLLLVPVPGIELDVRARGAAMELKGEVRRGEVRLGPAGRSRQCSGGGAKNTMGEGEGERLAPESRRILGFGFASSGGGGGAHAPADANENEDAANDGVVGENV